MEILFLGGTFSRQMEDEILEKSLGAVHYAANKWQWNLVDGLINIEETKLQILSAPFVGSYPKEYTDLRIKKNEEIYKGNVRCRYVSFLNIWGYRNISRRNALRKEMKKFLNTSSDKKTIIIYSPHTPFLQVAMEAKKKDPTIHICLIVPDLPQYMNLSSKKTILYKCLKKIDIKIFEGSLKYVDSYVLLTEHMKEVLKISEKPYLVIEGIVNNLDIEKYNGKVNKKEKVVVYTGTLNKKFGVLNLVKAFHQIEDVNITLKICGKGDSEEIIREYIKKDSRICLLGQVSNEEAIRLQRIATVLVNPRQADEEFTRYSFPSKNMEYLLTGNPVVAYKLEGIPKEYNKHFIYVKDNSIEALREKLEEVLAMSPEKRNQIGLLGKDFVIKKKNNNEASNKIFNMIKSNQI